MKKKFWFCLLSTFACVATLAAPALADAALRSSPDASSWVPDGAVTAAAWDGGKLFLGGSFTRLAPRTGPAVPVSTATGAALATYPIVSGGTVSVITPDGSGGWFLGGNFTRVGGLDRTWLAHVLADGTVDPNWNPGAQPITNQLGANNRVTELVLSGGTLYVGGSFAGIGGASRNGLAAVDAATGAVTAWNPQIAASNPISSAYISDIEVAPGTVYLAGGFATIGGQARVNVAAVSSSTGSVSSWNAAVTGSVSDLAISAGVVYLAGDFTSAGGQARRGAAAVDATTALATSWNPNLQWFGAATNAYASIVKVDGSRVYLGGTFTAVGGSDRYGLAAVDVGTAALQAWSPSLGSPYPGTLYDIEPAGGTVYVAGDFTTVAGATRRGAAAIDANTGAATSWDPHTTAGASTVAVSGGTAYVGGYFAGLGGVARNKLAQIDPTTGQPTSWSPVNSSGLAAQALLVSGGIVYAGGSSGNPTTSLGAFDETSGEVPAGWSPQLGGGYVSSLAVAAGRLYVGGDFTSASSLARNGLAALTPATGAAQAWAPSFPSGTRIASIATAGDVVYAAGNFTQVGGQNRSRIAALDATTAAPTTWDAAPSASTGTLAVNALATSADGTLYVGGHFSTIGGQLRANIAALTPTTGAATTWNPGAAYASVPSIVSVYSMSIAGPSLFLNGTSPLTISGQTRQGVAEISLATGAASAWNPASGFSGGPIAADSSHVAVGGLSFVGNEPTSGYAYFSQIPEADTTPPSITVSRPTDSQRFPQGPQVTSVFSCSDTGGSGMDSCQGDAVLDTATPGAHTFTAVAKDLAGNTTTKTVRYFVDAASSGETGGGASGGGSAPGTGENNNPIAGSGGTTPGAGASTTPSAIGEGIAASPDATPALKSLLVSAGKTAKTLRKNKQLTVAFTCPAAGKLQLTLTAKKTVGSLSYSCKRKGTSAILKLTASKTGKKQLIGKKKLKLKLAATFTPSGARTQTQTTTLTVK
jgi:hypothetical protein